MVAFEILFIRRSFKIKGTIRTFKIKVSVKERKSTYLLRTNVFHRGKNLLRGIIIGWR